MDAQYTLNRMRCAPSRIHDFARAQVGRSCIHQCVSDRTITTACPFVAFSDVDAHETMQRAPLRRAKNPQLLNLLFKASTIIPHLISLRRKCRLCLVFALHLALTSFFNAVSFTSGLHGTRRAFHLSSTVLMQGGIESCHTSLGTQDPSGAYKRLCPP